MIYSIQPQKNVVLIVSSYNSREKINKDVFGGIKLCCFDNLRHTVTFTKYCQCILQLLMDLSLQDCCHRLTILELGM